MTQPTRQQREAAGLVHAAAWLTPFQADTVAIWEANNLADAALAAFKGDEA